MVNNIDFSTLNKEQLDTIKNRRVSLRHLYCDSVDGLDAIFDLIKGSKVFEKIDAKNQEEIGARNLIIDLLNDLGFFDEEFIKKQLKNLYSFPLVPHGAEESVEDRGEF